MCLPETVLSSSFGLIYMCNFRISSSVSSADSSESTTTGNRWRWAILTVLLSCCRVRTRRIRTISTVRTPRATVSSAFSLGAPTGGAEKRRDMDKKNGAQKSTYFRLDGAHVFLGVLSTQSKTNLAAQEELAAMVLAVGAVRRR